MGYFTNDQYAYYGDTMAKIADVNLIKWLLKNKSGYRIAKDTGISQSAFVSFKCSTKIHELYFSSLTANLEKLTSGISFISAITLIVLTNSSYRY
ncbi:hypothetical protein HZY91_03700 [Facklamia sp. DSM 111018]|uniref:HTH cro/C1-type domain-containing protein n=1 Tax=Facklamia lactis TaxID=2749967 RepID=A0ABS0LRM3_9LACT|nr:hypothetical protein [Facklamia lactis]